MESNKRVTAVEWLEERYNDPLLKDNFISKAEFDQAKAMEKKQIIEAYRDGRTDQQTRVPKFYNRSSAIYYTSTFGS